MEEPTCRICRCEGSPDDPLFHPCKCRGSIKYIHQDCLSAWLSHSNKQSCDICHTPYTFKTIFDDNTPKTVPFSLFIKKIIGKLKIILTNLLIFSLVWLFIVIEVPIFMMITLRLFTWLISDNDYIKQENLIFYLLFGNNNNNNNNTAATNDINSFDLNNFKKIIFDNFIPGIRNVIILSLAIAALVSEHEWVTKDEGFTKIIETRIGPHPKKRLFDMFQAQRDQQERRILADRRLREEAQRQRQLQRERDRDLQEQRERNRDLQREPREQREQNHAAIFNQNELEERNRDFARQIFNGPFDNRFENDNNNIINNNNNNNDPFLNDGAGSDSDFDDEINAFDINNFLHQNNNNNNNNNNDNDDDDDFDEDNFDNLLNNNNNNGQNNQPADRNDEAIHLFEELIRLQVEQENIRQQQQQQQQQPQQQQQQQENAENDENANIERPNGFFDAIFPPTFPLKLSAIVNLVIIIMLCSFYFMPILFGCFFTPIIISLISLQLDLISYLFIYLNNLTGSIISTYYFNLINSDLFKIIINHPSISIPSNYLLQNYFSPILNSCNNILMKFLNSNQLSSSSSSFLNFEFTPIFFTPLSSNTEILICLSIGYLVYASAIGFTMYKLEKNTSISNPLTGVKRQIYVFLLEIVCTLKVICIFSIELVFFPIFCGYQLSFVLAPVLTENDIMFEPIQPSFWFNWVLGTVFMYLFASFVSMARARILRKGVLFFIRSPDDPNVRLVHDALMKPFGLQISRISLSGAVYTAYIIVEFAVISWGLRYLSPLRILPINSFFGLLDAGLFFYPIYSVTKPLTKYFRSYWQLAFKYSCSLLRLSSFILDEDKSSERGHIVYRSYAARLFSRQLPDFTKPIPDFKTIEFFKSNPNIHCVFVPDGNYIRAPDDDNVSRLFLKLLFVPVTKDDKLLNPIDKFDDKNDAKYNPYGDEELVSIKTYTVVYRPPNFRTRIFGLLGCLWIYSLFLGIAYILISFIIGKSILLLIGDFTISPIYNNITNLKIMSILRDNFYSLDLLSILIGGYIIQLIFKGFDIYITSKETAANNLIVENNEIDNDIDDNNNDDNNVAAADNAEVERSTFTIFIDNTKDILMEKLENISEFLMLVYITSTWFIVFCFIHHVCISYGFDIYGEILSKRFNSKQNIDTYIGFAKLTVHAITGLFTVVSQVIQASRLNQLGNLNPVEASRQIKIDYQPCIVTSIAIICKSIYEKYLTTNSIYINDSIFKIIFNTTLNVCYGTESFCIKVALFSWIVCLLFKLFFAVKNYMLTVNDELRTEFYGKGKILTNVGEDDDQ
ncbi:hypothetical protein B5S31_g5508 [[Candida] boidinii]|nr:hypothetical protein B5S29_g4390 [[Candida] boidinii]OWB75585.1 hypothetical protein B5S31_g5508 [[Candida] boidinii]